MKWTQNKKKEPICNQRNFWSYSIIKCYILISISNWLVNIPFTNLFWCWIYLNFVMIINLERHHQTNTTYSRQVNAIQFKDDVHHLTQLSLLLCRGDVRKLHNRLWCLISEQSPLGAAQSCYCTERRELGHCKPTSRNNNSTSAWLEGGARQEWTNSDTTTKKKHSLWKIQYKKTSEFPILYICTISPTSVPKIVYKNIIISIKYETIF